MFGAVADLDDGVDSGEGGDERLPCPVLLGGNTPAGPHDQPAALVERSLVQLLQNRLVTTAGPKAPVWLKAKAVTPAAPAAPYRRMLRRLMLFVAGSIVLSLGG
ncbi:hypothetical protein GCM10029976_077210 [Kribbella albertanoniae]